MASGRPEALFGGILRQLAGNIAGKMASKRQLGGNLGHLKAILRSKRAQELIGSQGVGGMREALLAPQEGNSEEIEPCPSGRNPTQRAGLKAAAGFSPQSGSPGAA